VRRDCPSSKITGNDGRALSLLYLPGGRGMLHKRAEDAVLREVRKALWNFGANSKTSVDLSGFFKEEVSGEAFHELCLYFLPDVGKTDILDRGERFLSHEGRHTHEFCRIPFERLKDEYLYPLFIKDAIFHLPDTLTLRTERE